MEFKREDIMNEKGYKIRDMFASIAYRYDFLNRLLSFGMDSSWRKKVVGFIKPNARRDPLVIDLACGTGDLSIEMANNGLNVVGVDFCKEMLEKAKEKIELKGLGKRISLIDAPVESLPFKDKSFDYATIAFGIRNLYDPLRGLQEIRRVLKREGKVIILEFSLPRSGIFKKIYLFYFLRILPFIGRAFTHTDAYYYLASSVMEFPKYEDFVKLMEEAGLREIRYYPLTGGIVSIYIGKNGN